MGSHPLSAGRRSAEAPPSAIPLYVGRRLVVILNLRSIAMASGKTLSKSETAAFLAERAGITKKQAQSVIEAQAELAYKQAKNTFVVPGLGKLVLVDRPARKMIMRFGPDAGQEKLIPKKKVLKFRIAKAAKDAILGPR